MKRIFGILLSALLLLSLFSVTVFAADYIPELKKGDVNADGKLDADDYILAKRAYFGMADLDNDAVMRADINGNGIIDADDYICLKRAYFGQYTIIEDEAKPEADISAVWELIFGCWGDEETDERFVYFTYSGEDEVFLSGEWGNPIPFGRDAAFVSSAVYLEGDIYIISIEYPPNEENAADSLDLRPLTYTVTLDISELENGRITVEAPDDIQRTYVYKGESYSDVLEERENVQYATFDEVQELWTKLTGYWNGDDGRFICFDQMDSNTLIFMEGIWDSETRGWGEFEKAMSANGAQPMKLVIYYPPVSNELVGELPFEYVAVYVGYTELEANNRISVKIDENGVWMTYSYAGETEEEARSKQ